MENQKKDGSSQSAGKTRFFDALTGEEIIPPPPMSYSDCEKFRKNLWNSVGARRGRVGNQKEGINYPKVIFIPDKAQDSDDGEYNDNLDMDQQSQEYWDSIDPYAD